VTFTPYLCKMNVSTLQTCFNIREPFCIIAGPCSAESSRQVIETARKLRNIPFVKVFRAGIWKPRTHPSDFEGVGARGLAWMKKVREETGLLPAIEVARPVHVEQALKNNIDILWIGARTTVNPFLVQEISEALAGTDVTVMVKNPLNPDLGTWVGAMERLNKNGIRKIVAIHRGFSFFRRSPFRNAPMWEIPIELKRLYAKLPVIVDPSHICGKKDLLVKVSQRAIDLEMDGLMIETHIHPSQAKTDREQQITPEALKRLVSRLVFREKQLRKDFREKPAQLRTEIDKLDWELLDILSRRMEIVKEIGVYKKENNITILQIKRWREIIENRLMNGKNLGLEKAFLQKLLEIVHDESIRVQTRIINNEEREQ